MGKNGLETRTIAIRTEYITLGQFLKFVGIVDQGGHEKAYLATKEVKVNGEPESRRGRKLRPGDSVEAEGATYTLAAK